MKKIKKAIIPLAGLGTRFLPLSKVLPKEFWPLVDKPVLQYIVEEVVTSGIREIIFVNRPGKKEVKKYFKDKVPELKELLKKKKKDYLLKELKELEKISKNVSFSEVFQKEPLGDGDAVLKAKRLVKKENFAVLFADDVVESKIPALSQLIKVFEQYKKPILALYRLPKESLSSYGIVGVEKIKNGIYKIKKIVEKPLPRKAPSNLAIVGKYILTPKVFDYLQKRKPSKRGEIILAETFEEMIERGEEIYGYEIKGRWLECGNKLAYLKSNLYLSLKDPRFGKELKKFLEKLGRPRWRNW